MKKMTLRLLLIALFIPVSHTLFGQDNDSISVVLERAESQGLRDYFHFEGIDYFKLSFKGKELNGKHYVIISKEFWNKELTKVDTILDSAVPFDMRINGEELNFTVMVKKTKIDTVEFLFSFPWVLVAEEYKTTKETTYSLRNLFGGIESKHTIGEGFKMLVYSLPYIDPEMPGYLQYCELTREGIPPEDWGAKFGIEHYIMFELRLE
ncbi:MAG: hypothetical protein IIA45_06085 [Bacteroidetes bacterium]|nr:hypothetical protein [Bacteroidota bacterium]